MGINHVLFSNLMHDLYDYGCNSFDTERFLSSHDDFLNRQADAIRIIEQIMTDHGKQELLRHVVELARVEHGIQELRPWVRDHVVHALLSFLLGIFLNEKFLKPTGNDKVSHFQWKLAGLFHDIGYPAQVAKDILRPFTDKINSIKRDLGINLPDVIFQVVPVGLDNLTNGVNSLDMFQKTLDDWGLAIDVRREYNALITSGAICHGMMSALAVLYVVDLMYQRYNPDRKYMDIYYPIYGNINWNQSYFDKDVIPACAAIFAHNLSQRCFSIARIDRKKAPLAFLLRLSDCLQDWERPSVSSPHGFSDSLFDITVIGGRLQFRVSDPVRRQKIENEVMSSLDIPDIDFAS